MLGSGRDDKEGLERAFAGVNDGIGSIFSSAGILSRYAWNAQMRFLVAAGLMPVFRNHPWLFLVVALVLLVVVVPVGVLWGAIALFALQNEPKAKNDFLVEIKSRNDEPPSLSELVEEPGVRTILSALARTQDGRLERRVFKIWYGMPAPQAERLLSHLIRLGLAGYAHDAPTESYLITDEGRALVARMGW